LILALAGGVGGAKLAHGLSMRLPAEKLQIVVNTGDDFNHLGLHISPDVDTVMYWLAGVNDRTRGWGLADESWNFMAALEKLGGPGWFKLGDRDLATHIERTRRLNGGESLSQVTRFLCERLGLRHLVAQMTDRPVRTIVHTNEGELEFQHYFVRRQCEPRVIRLEYKGAGEADPSPAFEAALARDDLEAIVICPSNPMLSIEPILALRGVRAKIERQRAPVVAVSPIVGGQAIKGPAAKILRELGHEPSAFEVARYYADLIDGIVIDEIDAALRPTIEKLNMNVAVANTVMKGPDDQAKLANDVIDFAATLGRP
jgi:LPPG:FO 2-phospho-L-lactate transferase